MSVFAVFAPEMALLELVEREIGHHPTSCLDVKDRSGSRRLTPRRVPIGGGDLLDLREMPPASLAALLVARNLKWGKALGRMASRVMLGAWFERGRPIRLPGHALAKVRQVCDEIATGVEEHFLQTEDGHQPWDILVDSAARSTGVLDRLTLEEQAALVCADLGLLPSGFDLYANPFGERNTYSQEVYDRYPEPQLPERGDILWEMASLVLAREGPNGPTGDCSPLKFHEALKEALGRYCANHADSRQRQPRYRLYAFPLDGFPWEQRTAAEMERVVEGRKQMLDVIEAMNRRTAQNSRS